jgi:hypothetical protein
MSAELKRPRAEIRARVEKPGLKWEDFNRIRISKASPDQSPDPAGLIVLFNLLFQSVKRLFSFIRKTSVSPGRPRLRRGSTMRAHDNVLMARQRTDISCDSDIEKQALFRYNLIDCFKEDRPANDKRLSS